MNKETFSMFFGKIVKFLKNIFCDMLFPNSFSKLNKIVVALFLVFVSFALLLSWNMKKDSTVDSKTNKDYIFDQIYFTEADSHIRASSAELSSVPSYIRNSYLQKMELLGISNLDENKSFKIENRAAVLFCNITKSANEGDLQKALEDGFLFVEQFSHHYKFNKDPNLAPLEHRLFCFQIFRNIAFASILGDNNKIKKSIMDFLRFSGCENTFFEKNTLPENLEDTVIDKIYKDFSFFDMPFDFVLSVLLEQSDL